MKKALLIMAMVGLVLWFPLLADAKGGKKDGKQDKTFQKAIKNLQKQIDKIKLTPGPQGADGECDCPITQDELDDLYNRIADLESFVAPGVDNDGETWNAYFTETGGEEQGPFELGLEQEGNSLILCESDRLYYGSVNGIDISIDLVFAQFVGNIVSNSLMQGTYPGGIWRMVKTSDTSICIDPSYWDIDNNGIPKFVTANYIELSKIDRITKFRSGVGHDYSDDFEACRSMKHYYFPFEGLDGSQIKIFSPIGGTILKIELEGYPNSGMQVHIQSTAYPAFTFRIFHVDVDKALSVGDSVTAGQEIGTHIGTIPGDDIAVGVTTPDGWELVSFFSVLTDTLFQTYQNRGVQSRDDFIISKEARDSDPLNCTGETFGTSGTIENWVNLE